MKKTLLVIILFAISACSRAPQLVSQQTSEPDLQKIKQTVREKFPTVRQLATTDLDAWMKDNSRAKPLILDARKPEEFAVSHLQRAVNAGDDAQLAAALKDIPKDQPIVAYCSVGYRSSALSEKLMKQGFTNVANLEGSIFQWANEGRPVFQGEQQVKQVHPFDAKWGNLLRPELRAPLKN